MCVRSMYFCPPTENKKDVAEDNIGPISLTANLALQFFKEVTELPRYFSDAIIDPEVGLGRWQLSPELQRAYPDDEQASQIEDELSV
jgi:hypothetical protein